MDIESLLVSAPWLCVGIWIVLYVADYYLTIAGARLYAQGAKDHVVTEGSYELNPGFVADVNALRLFSPRFIKFLVLTSLYIAGAWYVVEQLYSARNLFLFLYGAFVFLELAILARHATNIPHLRRLKAHQGVDGQVQFARWLTLETSAISLVSVAALLLVAALVTWKATLFGGVVGLLALGLRHASRARRLRSMPPTPADPVPADGVQRAARRSRTALLAALILVSLGTVLAIQLSSPNTQNLPPCMWQIGMCGGDYQVSAWSQDATGQVSANIVVNDGTTQARDQAIAEMYASQFPGKPVIVNLYASSAGDERWALPDLPDPLTAENELQVPEPSASSWIARFMLVPGQTTLVVWGPADPGR